MTETLTWPLRPIVRRIVRDLGDFAGITWVHLASVCIPVNAAIRIAGPWGGQPFMDVMVVAAKIWLLIAARMASRAVVEGRRPDGALTLSLIFAAVFAFWWAVIGALMMDPAVAALMFIEALFWGLLAWGPDDDDRGTPFIVRAWRAAKAAVRVDPVPSGVGS